MSIDTKREKINEGAMLTTITDKKFKTNSVVIRFIVPLSEESAAANSLAAQLLILSHKKYGGLTAITDFTNKLYGASIGASTFKVGDNQVVAFTASSIRNEYALEGEQLFESVIKVLLECIFDPDEFSDKYFELKKAELISSIDSEVNEKRTFAILNATSAAFENEPYALPPYGTRASAEALTKDKVFSAYDKAKELIKQRFDKPNLKAKSYPFINYSAAKAGVKYAEDSFDMNQLKMVMVFKTSYRNDAVNGLFSALLGGTPFSKLFMNVREKLSLCYYCASRVIYEKGAIMIDSGIDPKNLEEAKAEILNQLDQIKKGNFTDEELYNTKLALKGSFVSVYDSPSDLAAWYFIRTARGHEGESPDDAQKKMFEVTRDEIIAAANSLTLDTVYTLKNNGGEKQ